MTNITLAPMHYRFPPIIKFRAINQEKNTSDQQDQNFLANPKGRYQWPTCPSVSIAPLII